MRRLSPILFAVKWLKHEGSSKARRRTAAVRILGVPALQLPAQGLVFVHRPQLFCRGLDERTFLLELPSLREQ